MTHMTAAEATAEAGTGEINYPFLFKHLDRLGYTGWIGCKYKPATTTAEGLRWLDQVTHSPNHG